MIPKYRAEGTISARLVNKSVEKQFTARKRHFDWRGLGSRVFR
jgi:hypothetical protein